MHSSKPKPKRKHEAASPPDLREDEPTSVDSQAVNAVPPSAEAEQVERKHDGTIEYWYFCDGTSSLRW